MCTKIEKIAAIYVIRYMNTADSSSAGVFGANKATPVF